MRVLSRCLRRVGDAPETAALAERWYAEAVGRGIPRLCYVEGTLPGAGAALPFLTRVLREGAVVLGDAPDDDLPRRAALDLSRLEGWREPAPVTPPPDLVGRAETLAELREALTGRRAVLVGPRGVGKTVLARALACSEAHRYPGGVFWAAVGGHADLPGLLATLTRAWALCHPEARVREGPAGADVRRCLTDAPGPVLIIFDDVTDRDLLRGLVEQLCPPAADILATSRWPDVADLDADRPWPRVHVQRLRQHDSLWLLRTAARFDIADEHAEPIAQALGGQPLALRLAGSLLARAPSPRGAARLTDDLRGEGKAAPALGVLPLGPHERDEALEPVLAAVYRRLPEGRRLRFRALGVVPADTPLGPDLLGDLWAVGLGDTSEDPIETAFALGNAGLIERPAGPPPGWPHAHALIVAYARALLARESEADPVVVRYLDCCARLLAAGRARDDMPAHARQARELAAGLVRRMTGLPDLAAALSLSPPGDDDSAGTTTCSRLTPAEGDALTAVCRLAEAALGANEGDAGDWPLLLAAAAHALGRRDAFAAGLAAAERAGLRSPAAAPVPTDPGSRREELSPAAALRRLAELTHAGWDHYLARRWDQAEAVYRAALDLAERHGSAEGRISVLNNWGELCRSTGRLTQAEELLTRAYEEIPPDRRGQHPSLLHNVGLLRRAQGDLPRARELLIRAVEGHNVSGFDPDSLDPLSALAGVCLDPHELDEAERRITEGLNRAGQHRLPKAIAEFRHLQGDLARHRGRPLEALPHYQFALDEALARHHPVDEGTARHQIGLAHLEAGQPDLAAAAFQAAVGLSRGAGDRPGATVSSALLGSALLKAGRADEAVRWLAPAAEALREIGNRPKERTARLDLAAALHRRGRGAESAEALARGLELTRELHGERAAQVARIQFVAQLREQSSGSEVAPDDPPSHEALARVMGETRQAGDRHGEAELLLQESLAALQRDDADGTIASARRAAELARELGATHLEGAARTNLGDGLRHGGRPEEAVEEFGRAIPLLEAGGNPNSLADAHNNLGLALMESGRWAEAIPHLEETVRLKRQIGRPGGAAIAERLLAQACQQLDQFAACAEHARAAAALFRQAGRPERVPELLLTSAAASAELDDSVAAAADLEQAAAAREIGSAPELATALAMRGVLLGFRLDRPDEGAAALEEAAGLAHALGLGGRTARGDDSGQLARSGATAPHGGLVQTRVTLPRVGLAAFLCKLLCKPFTPPCGCHPANCPSEPGPHGPVNGRSPSGSPLRPRRRPPPTCVSASKGGCLPRPCGTPSHDPLPRAHVLSAFADADRGAVRD